MPLRNAIRGSYIVGVLWLASFSAHALGADLIGVVLDGKNNPLQASPITLQAAGTEVARAKSDTVGRFIIRNLRPGVYQMRCGNRQAVSVRIMDGLNEINCRG